MSLPDDSQPKPQQTPVVESSEQNSAATRFPVAQVREARNASALLMASRMWWVTAVCLLVAFWLTWRAIPAHGPTVVIQFPDGHGLKSGDGVRHRGIDVGIVSEVVLSDDLSQISASVTLTPEAARLAREGSRFWIVRPQLSLTGVSGLETAVGAKYIAVSPGNPNGPARKSFEGLATAPPDEDSGNGIDIVLRSDARRGVTMGSPIAWRGVDVGQTLSIHLSPDARFVDIHARIQPEYSRLLQKTSRFWVTSGLGVDVGLTGLHLNADSLSSIVRGGISFATPTASDDRSPIQSGQMFLLHEKPDPAWLNSAASLPLIGFSLPPTVMIHGTRETSLLGISRTKEFSINGLVVRRDGNTLEVLTASDILPTDTEASDTISGTNAEFRVESLVSEFAATMTLKPKDTPANKDEVTASAGYNWLVSADLKHNFAAAESTDLRVPTQPEDCCICRSVRNDGIATSVIQSISQDQITANGATWSVAIESSDHAAWHGAPLVSMADGKIIGVFLASKKGAVIATLRQ